LRIGELAMLVLVFIFSLMLARATYEVAVLVVTGYLREAYGIADPFQVNLVLIVLAAAALYLRRQPLARAFKR